MPFDCNLFSQTQILVVGDVMLDRYNWGEVRRISPEAPVPVVRVLEKSMVLGGAGNVAANLAGLGCSVDVIGLCGDDQAGELLNNLFSEKNIKAFLIEDKLRTTTTKTRIMAKGQQLFRLDEEVPGPVTSDIAGKVITAIEKRIPSCQAVILSDYGKGLLQSKDLCNNIIDLCRKQDLPIIVDPKGADWDRYQKATAVTPNTAELTLVTKLTLERDEKVLASAARDVRQRFNLDWLLVTRGPKGMYLTGPDNLELQIPAMAREVFDVSGAGDTVIATLSAGLATGLPFPDAADLANTAASIVVGKLGTQPVTKAELESVIRMNDARNQTPGHVYPIPLDTARIQVKSWRASGNRIVFTNGCFDLLHPGHINLLHQARALGDRLVIGLNTDASVKRLKGEKRPILSETDRASMLNALECVDLVVLFDEDTPIELIKTLKPEILVKGADYKPEEVVGREEVESFGGKVCLVELLEGYSTTGIANKVLSAGKND